MPPVVGTHYFRMEYIMEGKWIYIDEAEHKADSYAEFIHKFSSSTDSLTLRVSSDSFFVARLNGEIVLFSGCADYPHYKLYDEISGLKAKCGENELHITVWYHGTTTQTYLHDDPGVWFEVLDGDTVIAASSTETLGRKELNFRNGACKIITYQLGYSFYYDNTFKNSEEYKKTVSVQKMRPTKRQQKPLVLDGRANATYTYFDDHILIDFGRESAGYPDLDFVSPEEQELLFTFGEHLEIGKVSREIDGRDFSFEFKAKAGENKFFCPLRRIACRYVEVYFKTKIDVNYIGIQEVYYPVTEKEKRIDDPLLRKIYDVSVRTLRLCMHEHYEDCPWREQALYALDSRNQMLFGYHTFKETEYQRSNLLLINQGILPGGLLSICFPAGDNVPIPFFSLAFILEVCEYAKNTGDYSIIADTEKTAKTIINTFVSKIGENGLIPTLPAPYWNFYEWSEGNDGDIGSIGKKPHVVDYDLIMNAMFVWVVGMYNETAGTTYDTESVKSAIENNLYCKERGLYKISLNGTLFGQLGNALAILAGLGTPELAKKVASIDGLTPATLSMKPFVYDALLKSGDEYKDYVIDDIKRVYSKMLDYGATSFWETELGWKDFWLAGSLCHGWSASPAYYLSILGYAEDV